MPYTLILMVFALVFFILAGLGIPSPTRFNFLGFGLACTTAAAIVSLVK